VLQALSLCYERYPNVSSAILVFLTLS